MDVTMPDGTVIANVPEGTTKSQLLARYKKSTAPAPAPAPQEPAAEPSFAEQAADIIKRFGHGAASLIEGSAQLGANLGTELNKHVVAPIAHAVGAHKFEQSARKYGDVVGDSINTTLQSQAEDRAKAQEAAGNGTADVAGVLGAIVPAALSGGATLAAAAPRSLAARSAIGAATGAGWGATAPVTTGSDNFWNNKGSQAATGAAVGAAAPLVTALASKIGSGVRDAYDVLSGSDSSIDRLKRAYYQKIIGEKNIPSVTNSLDTVDPLVAGGKPTVAEAVSANPHGTALQAQQRITAQTPGGVSGDFNARLNLQNIARESAKWERAAITDPMREAALANATSIDHAALNNDIVNILKSPEIQSVTTSRRFMGRIANDIGHAKSGSDLYGIRKNIGDLLETKLESEKAVPKSLVPKLIEMKDAIDAAIGNGGGGQLWKDYLNEFATRSHAIESSIERAKEMYQPLQRTSVAGSNISEANSVHLPNLLSRTAMIANWLAKAARANVEPKLDASMAQDFLNPQVMSDVLKRATPKQQVLATAIAKRMMNRGAPIAAGDIVNQVQQGVQ